MSMVLMVSPSPVAMLTHLLLLLLLPLRLCFSWCPRFVLTTRTCCHCHCLCRCCLCCCCFGLLLHSFLLAFLQFYCVCRLDYPINGPREQKPWLLSSSSSLLSLRLAEWRQRFSCLHKFATMLISSLLCSLCFCCCCCCLCCYCCCCAAAATAVIFTAYS